MTKMANQQTNFPFSKIIPQLDIQDNWEKKYQTDFKKKKKILFGKTIRSVIRFGCNNKINIITIYLPPTTLYSLKSGLKYPVKTSLELDTIENIILMN